MSLLIPAILSPLPAAAPGAIAYQSMGDVLELTAVQHTGTTEAIDMPSALAAGDLLVAVIVYRGNSNPPVYPAGWTNHTNPDMRNTDWSVHVSIGTHPVVTPGGEPASITVTGLLADQPISGVIVRFSNGTSLDAIAGVNSGVPVLTTHPVPDVTPTAPSGILLKTLGAYHAATFTVTSPATQLLNQHTVGNNLGFGLSYAASSGTSPQGAANFTTSLARGSAGANIALH